MKLIQIPVDFIPSLIEVVKAFFENLVAILTKTISFREIVRWFHNNEQLKFSDQDNVAFTLMMDVQEGNHVVCQGIFNRGEGQVLDGQKLTGNRVDSDLAQTHHGRALVIYE